MSTTSLSVAPTHHRQRTIYFDLPDGRVVAITAKMLFPAEAAELLKLNTRNRPVRTDIADLIAQDISAGRWAFTGETIKIATDSDGTRFVADAQHRLIGIANGDRPVPVIIVENLSPEATKRIDQCRVRAVGDILRMTYARDNVKHETILGAISMLLLEATGSSRPPKDLVSAYANVHFDEFSEWAAWGKSVSRDSQRVSFGGSRHGSGLAPGPVAVLAMHMIESGAEVELVKDFFRRIATGSVSDSDQTNVIPALRRRQCNGIPLSRMGGGGSSLTGLLTEFATYITAYNRWVSGDRVETIKGSKQAVKTLSDLPPVSRIGR